jgi:molybdate transport system substrate-binding protein
VTRRPAALALFIAIFGAARSSAAGDDATLRIYVAASAGAVVETIVAQFRNQTGLAVEVSPGPSSRLAKQIAEGAPADLFLSADRASADYLEAKRLVAKRRNLLGNRLVVVVPADAPGAIASLADLARDEVREVALALEKVPAGEYARQALRRAGVWERVQAKVIGGEDVRATLAFVERGAAAGIVFRTDCSGNSRARVAFEVDASLHAPIEYPLVLIERARMNPRALELYERLTSEAAAQVFRRAHFHILR